MRSRLLGFGVSLALFLGLFAPAALAATDAGLFQGVEVTVGQKFNCTKSGGLSPSGAGLTFPQLKDVKTEGGGANKDRAFRFTGVVQSAQYGEGFADVCGFITKVAGIGPRCGWSKGYNGKGLVTFPNAPGGAVTLKVSNLTWKLGPATVLPITARVHNMVGGQKTKASRLYAVASVLIGGANCSNGWNPLNTDRNKPGQAGETSFIVGGVYVTDQTGFGREWKDITNCPGVEPKNDGKSTIGNVWGDKKDKKSPKTPRPADNGPLPTCKAG